jgi:outer membrane protein TolC
VLKSLREEQPAVALSAPLDADAAVALALAHNRSLGPAREATGVARAGLKAATDINNPTIRVVYDDLNLPSRAGWQLSARWAPPKPWEVATESERARREIDKAEEELAEATLALAGEVKREHAELVSVESELGVAKAAADSRRALVSAIDARVQKGAGTRLDLASAKVSVAEAEATIAELSASRATTVERLRGLMGLAPGEAYSVKSAPAPRRDVPLGAALEELALKQRPALRVDWARHAAQAEEVALARMENLPWFKIVAGPRVELTPAINRTAFNVGLEFSLPLWDWNTGHIALEEAKLKRDEARYRAEVTNLRRDVAVARSDLEARRAAVEQLEKQLLPALEERLDAAKKGLEAAQLDTTALLEAEEQLWKGRRQLVRANRELKQAWVRLERVLGAPVP